MKNPLQLTLKGILLYSLAWLQMQASHARHYFKNILKNTGNMILIINEK
ncbi:MAG: hypothetical protein ABL895_20545 [Cyclobacteriaceae bacterium]